MRESPGTSTDQPQPFSGEDIEALVDRMARVGACRSPSFAPDGTRLTFVSDLSGVPQVWIVPSAGGWPERITALDDPINAVAWSPDGAWLAFALAPGGGMNEQVYVIRPDGSGLRRLTDGGKETNGLGEWTADGRALMITSNRRDGAAIDAYLVRPPDFQLQLVDQNPGIGHLMDVRRDGRFGVLYRMENRSDDNLFLLDLQTGATTLLTPHEGPGSFGNGRARFSPDGRMIYLASNKDRELMAFARIPLAEGGNPGPIEVLAERDDAELQDFEISDEGQVAALIWNIAGRNEITFLDLVSGAQTPAPPLPAEVISTVRFAADGQHLAIAATGSVAPLDIWVLERDTGKVRQVTHSPHSGVDLTRLVRPELVRFPAHDGLELTGWLYRPQGTSGPGPLVLNFHGGPEGQEQPYFSSTFQALAAAGIAALSPNVRGSAGFGKTFVNLDNGPLRVDAIRDIAACLDFVAGERIADPARIGIMGGSYGGYMTMAGLTTYPDRFAAGANLYGVVNFETFFAHTEPWMAAISKVEYGDPETEADMLRELSPLHHIDRVQAPTLVLHGANDTNVPVVEAEQVVASLRERGVPVEYILFPDEGHGFRKTANRVRSTGAIVRWFAKHLGGRPVA